MTLQGSAMLRNTLRIGALALALSAATAATAQTQAPPPPPASDFATMAAQSDQYEIQAGRTATVQATDPRVRAFAQQMVTDHTRTSQALQQAASASGLPPPPPAVGADQSRMLNALQGLTGREFDRAYMKQQVLAHEQALAVQQTYAAGGKDPNLRSAAQTAVPQIQHHLEMARQLSSAVGGA